MFSLPKPAVQTIEINNLGTAMLRNKKPNPLRWVFSIATGFLVAAAICLSPVISTAAGPISGSVSEPIVTPQSYTAPSTIPAHLIAGSTGYSVKVIQPKINWASVASLANAKGADFSNNLHAAIQYPFGLGANVSSGYGPRTSQCSEQIGCSSSFHEGTDFGVPAGTPIQAIATGKVITANNAGAFGEHVVIEHTIDGHKVTSLYAHMLQGSIKVTKGQEVVVGDLIGEVGNTGRSFGAHLHFELTVDGQKINPLTWDKWNTGSYMEEMGY